MYRALKPQDSKSMSGTVIVSTDKGDGYAFIRYDHTARERIAQKMPRGIGQAEPVYIHVVHEIDTYAVYCVYYETRETVLLWRQTSLPLWVGKIKMAEPSQ